MLMASTARAPAAVVHPPIAQVVIARIALRADTVALLASLPRRAQAPVLLATIVTLSPLAPQRTRALQRPANIAQPEAAAQQVWTAQQEGRAQGALLSQYSALLGTGAALVHPSSPRMYALQAGGAWQV